jgi:hypothetical protein
MTLSSLVVPVRPEALTSTTEPAEAFARLQGIIEAVSDEQLVAINVDIPTVVSMVRARVPRLQTLAAGIDPGGPRFDLSCFARLPTIAQALIHAHADFMTAAAPVSDDLGALQEIGLALRTRLLDDASYLVKKGLLEAGRLEQIKGLAGFRNLAFDLLGLVQLFEDAWAVAAQKSAVDKEDLGKASLVANRILDALAAREQSAAASAKAAVVRQKAYSLFFHDYDAVQRIVHFVRWAEDDADDVAPSLFTGRRTSRRGSKTTPATPVAPSMPATPSTPGPLATPAAHTPEAPRVPGGPGGSPFIS